MGKKYKKVFIFILLNISTFLFAKTELSINVGTNSFASKEGLNSATSLGIRGDFYLDNLYHLDFGFDNFDDVKCKNSDDTATIKRLYTQFSADGEEEYHVVPSLSVGAGYERQDYSDDTNAWEPFLSLGIGFRYNLSRAFNFLLGSKVLWKTHSRSINYHTTFGVGYLIDDAPVNNEDAIEAQEVVIPSKKLQINNQYSKYSTSTTSNTYQTKSYQVPQNMSISKMFSPASSQPQNTSSTTNTLQRSYTQTSPVNQQPVNQQIIVSSQNIPQTSIPQTQVQTQIIEDEPIDAKTAATLAYPQPVTISKRASYQNQRAYTKYGQGGGTKYYIQVAAFSRFKPTSLLDRLYNRGYKIILRHQGGVTKALIGPYFSEYEAQKAKIQIRVIAPRAFIYKEY